MKPEGLTALRESSQLSVEISDLLRHPAASRRLEFSEEVPGLALDMGRVPRALSFELVLEGLVEGILVSGRVRGSYRLACRRCLGGFDQPFEVGLSEVVPYPRQPGAEEGYRVEGDQLLLEPLVRDAVILAMPLNPLCRPECRGLCAECGADRNAGDCGHRPGRVDVRWEPLGRLRDQMGE